MIVIDASALTNALIYSDERGRKARAVLGRDPEWAAPEHCKVEVFAAIRGLALGRKVSHDAALQAASRLPALTIDHVPLDPLLPLMWQLRESVSGYDAPYVALAEARGLALVTADNRLARAAARHCRVELAHP